MANKRRDVYKAKPMNEGKKAVIQGLLNEYDILADFQTKNRTSISLWDRGYLCKKVFANPYLL